MHDRALQHHRARADIVEAPVIVEGEGARGDQHELKAARRQMQMEIGGAGVGTIDRQIGRDFVEQEGFVVGVEAFVGAVVEGLRPIRRLELRIPVAIDRHEILGVEAERRAVRVGEAGRLEIARSMHVHDVLRSAPLPACNVIANFGPVHLRDRQTGPAPWRGEAVQEKIRWLHGRLDRPLALIVRRCAGASRSRESGVDLSNLSASLASMRAVAPACGSAATSQFVRAAIDNMFMFCSYAATEMEAAMDNRINDIRRTIRALRVSMREAEAIMHEQINRDEDCSFVAQEVIKMRSVMSGLVKERTALGDTSRSSSTASSSRGAGRRESRSLLLPRPSNSVFRPRLVARV